ncbi:DUF1543 domain-containing protein [Achromobacter pulmonis]|uniref:DUF1543 domain-containing protein n=1 Tax=Achromobacter pulmonis TaxID=1389932 RepID=A0A2N8KK66_9BURK|nr:DUF1543 domain-containing protein [Achromobacter pulmonis]PND33846.1 DUF1543 domain-containing protein [Achromobacter pulmonis]
MFYVGGNAGKSNIEVHDVQFAAVQRPEDAWPLLREVWFGDRHKLHVDGYSVITWADGHDIRLLPTPFQGNKQLYFVNAGGYRPDTLVEQHEFGLFVAEDAAQAKRRALDVLLVGAGTRHKDNLSSVDDCVLLGELGGLHVHLRENPLGQPAAPAWQGYQPIGVPPPA